MTSKKLSITSIAFITFASCVLQVTLLVGQTEGQTDERTNGQMDRQTYGQRDRERRIKGFKQTD